MNKAAGELRVQRLRRFSRYPAYRDSGIGWLGEIPAHWEVKPLKRVTSLTAGSAITADTIEERGEIPVYGGNGIRGFTSSFTHEGSFPLIGRQGALCGCVNFASGRFWASEHAVVAVPVTELNPRWLAHLLMAMHLNRYSQSAAQPGLAVETISGLYVPVPPIREQHHVAEFLDEETARIDALIAKKQRVIELLYEKCEATIARLVTNGLSPALRTRTGIEWLGEMPAHWDAKRLRFLLRGPLQNGLFKKKDSFGSGTLLINVFDIYKSDFTIRAERLDRVQADSLEQQLYAVEPGDILFVRSSLKAEGVGRSASVQAIQEPMLFECHLVRVKPDPRSIDPRFLVHFLNSAPVRQRLISLANTVTMSTLPQSAIATLEVAVPPLSEQAEILLQLETKFKKLDAIVTRTRLAIERLKEFRAALIAATITGGIDVRAAKYES